MPRLLAQAAPTASAVTIHRTAAFTPLHCPPADGLSELARTERFTQQGSSMPETNVAILLSPTVKRHKSRAPIAETRLRHLRFPLSLPPSLAIAISRNSRLAGPAPTTAQSRLWGTYETRVDVPSLFAKILP